MQGLIELRYLQSLFFHSLALPWFLRSCRQWKSFFFVVAPALGFYCPGIQAQQAESSQNSSPRVWINPGIYSQHFDSSKGLRNNNIGLGVEVLLNENHGIMAGSFINSNRARTRYAGYQWRPFHREYSGIKVGAGIIVSAFDGYPNYRNGAWFVAPLPVLTIEGKTFGANIGLIPTVANRLDGAIAIQLKIRVW